MQETLVQFLGQGRSPGEGIGYPLQYSWASLVAQLVKKPAMQETWVRSLGWEEPWRRERLPTPVSWPGEFHGLYSSWGRKESDRTERLSFWASLVAQVVKTPPVIWETWVRSLGWEDPLEKGKATYSSILAQRIP